MILVLNRGSSSLKYALIDRGRRLAADSVAVSSTAAGLAAVAAALPGVNPQVVGHRVVHGGRELTGPTLIDAAVLAQIRALASLAPEHQPQAVELIEAAAARWPAARQFGVFDTAFHHDLPVAAATYAIDQDLAVRHGLRRYGMHGISYGYVAGRTAALLGRELTTLNLIVLHLGSGASAAAIAAGRSVETSMGLTPHEGLVMGSRSGDIDPTLPALLHDRAGLDWAQAYAELTERGGLRGLCGDADVRAVLRRRADGDAAATTAMAVYCHRIRKYVGAYYAVLGRLDAVVFTGGVGEHSAAVRAESLAGLEPMGIAVASGANALAGERIISPPGASVTVCVVPTDEEQAIADQLAAVGALG